MNDGNKRQQRNDVEIEGCTEGLRKHGKDNTREKRG
jgi:hypothetical protein